MSESAENDYLFVFIAHLVPEISLLLFFIMTSAAILDLEVKMIPKYFKWYFIRFVMLKIVRNDTFFIVIVYLVQEILIFVIFKMALAAILKNGL